MTRKTGLLRPSGANTTALARLSDVTCIAIAHAISVWLYARAQWDATDAVATLLAVLGFLLVAETTGLYLTWRGAPLMRELARVLATWASPSSSAWPSCSS